ncbi:MAG: diguanylate cyclase [bacterium]
MAKLLVTDDSTVIRNVMQDVLVSAGYSVATAPDGVEALEKLHSEDYDLLFLDLDMPNLSGLQVCRMLRNDPAFAGFPVIMLTARGEKKDEYWGKKTGADAYLTKPIEPDLLIETLERVLEETKWKPKNRLAAAMPREKGGEEQDLIFEAGQVQEDELFKMTLMNRVYEISHSRDNLYDTLKDIVQLYSSVVEFQLANFLVVDEEDRVRIFLFVLDECSREFFQSAKRQMIDGFAGRSERSPMIDNADVVLDDPKRHLLNESPEAREVDLYTMALEAKGEMYGMFALGRCRGKPFNADEIMLVKQICDHSSIVVENIRMHERIKEFAIADGLTGLYNHRYFQEQLEKEFSRARRYNLSLSLVMLDIDHFKDVNDSCGHQFGDTVLKAISGILRRSVRDIDLVGRYGGEEFVMILPETQKKNSRIVAERIRAKVEEQCFNSGSGERRITVSIGISGYPDDNIQTRLDLIAKADSALYDAKNKGRNRVCLYSPREEDEAT